MARDQRSASGVRGVKAVAGRWDAVAADPATHYADVISVGRQGADG